MIKKKKKKTITISHGTPVYLYKFIPNKLNSINHYLFINLIQAPASHLLSKKILGKNKKKFFFCSALREGREVGRYLSISQSTVSRYLKSGDLFKNKISYTLL